MFLFTVDTVHVTMYLVIYSPIPLLVTCILYNGSLCFRLKGSSPQPPVHSLVPRRLHRRLALNQSFMPGLPDQDLILFLLPTMSLRLDKAQPPFANRVTPAGRFLFPFPVPTLVFSPDLYGVDTEGLYSLARCATTHYLNIMLHKPSFRYQKGTLFHTQLVLNPLCVCALQTR